MDTVTATMEARITTYDGLVCTSDASGKPGWTLVEWSTEQTRAVYTLLTTGSRVVTLHRDGWTVEYRQTS